MRSARSNTVLRLPVQIAAWMLVAVAAFGCDRAVEPYAPGEKPEQPDLSRIFPEGAERAAEKKGGGPMGGAAASGMPGAPAAPAGRDASPAAGGDGAPLSGTIALAPGFETGFPLGRRCF